MKGLLVKKGSSKRKGYTRYRIKKLTEFEKRKKRDDKRKSRPVYS